MPLGSEDVSGAKYSQDMLFKEYIIHVSRAKRLTEQFTTVAFTLGA
jgi:hypothetical protein